MDQTKHEGVSIVVTGSAGGDERIYGNSKVADLHDGGDGIALRVRQRNIQESMHELNPHRLQLQSTEDTWKWRTQTQHKQE